MIRIKQTISKNDKCKFPFLRLIKRSLNLGKVDEILKILLKVVFSNNLLNNHIIGEEGQRKVEKGTMF